MPGISDSPRNDGPWYLGTGAGQQLAIPSNPGEAVKWQSSERFRRDRPAFQIGAACNFAVGPDQHHKIQAALEAAREHSLSIHYNARIKDTRSCLSCWLSFNPRIRLKYSTVSSSVSKRSS